ncbi:MAG: M48 family metalloprotease [Alphaproteobacteria bacterium]|nr:M48 family metalloprotease [Alphaproteobacteria bacterium]
MRSLIRFLTAAIILTALTSAPAQSQRNGIRLVRDAEIENIIRRYATPIFNAAGLSADDVNIHLVRDDRLNAFVAGGQRLFINTGLLVRAESPNAVIGVIAHEAGHIAGGHLARIQDELRNAEIKSILAAIVGVAVGAATGDGAAAGTIVRGGQGAALTDLLKYSRTQEAAADSAALKYLDATGQSARGIADFFRLLQHDIRLRGGREHPYLSSHPLTNDRISVIENHLALSRFADTPVPRQQLIDHQIMRAKLIGFTQPLKNVLRIFPETDKSIPARYARSTAHYLEGNLAAAVPLIDGMIAEAPQNPYFHELKGQMLFENGRIADSLDPYRKSVELAPREPLLRTALARAQIETGDSALLEEARAHLDAAASREPRMREIWRLTTIVNGRLGKMGDMALAQAEFELLGGEYVAARTLADRALDQLPTGSSGWLRAQDIRDDAQDRINAR